RAGLDPAALASSDKTKMDMGQMREAAGAKAWKDIWGAGQSVAGIDAVLPAAAIVEQLAREYHQVLAVLKAIPSPN
ncbi:MAG: nitronate monooxygenase, partial [Burkholderiaceae bacterium]